MDGNTKSRPCDSTKLSVSDKSLSERFKICLVVSLKASPKQSRLSERSKRLFLILEFDSVFSLHNARYLQNLTVLKNAEIRGPTANVTGKPLVVF